MGEPRYDASRSREDHPQHDAADPELLTGRGVGHGVDDQIGAEPGRCHRLRSPTCWPSLASSPVVMRWTAPKSTNRPTRSTPRDLRDGLVARSHVGHPVRHHAGILRQRPVQARVGGRLVAEQDTVPQMTAQREVCRRTARGVGTPRDLHLHAVAVRAEPGTDVEQLAPPSGLLGAADRPVLRVQARPGAIATQSVPLDVYQVQLFTTGALERVAGQGDEGGSGHVEVRPARPRC